MALTIDFTRAVTSYKRHVRMLTDITALTRTRGNAVIRVSGVSAAPNGFKAILAHCGLQTVSITDDGPCVIFSVSSN